MSTGTKVLSLNADFGGTVGTFTYVVDTDGSSISGHPSPSESQAWVFGGAVKAMEWFITLPYDGKMSFLKKLKESK